MPHSERDVEDADGTGHHKKMDASHMVLVGDVAGCDVVRRCVVFGGRQAGVCVYVYVCVCVFVCHRCVPRLRFISLVYRASCSRMCACVCACWRGLFWSADHR